MLKSEDGNVVLWYPRIVRLFSSDMTAVETAVFPPPSYKLSIPVETLG